MQSTEFYCPRSYHSIAFSRVQLTVFVDDLGFDFCGDECEARSVMAKSTTELDRVLVEDLHLALAHDKTFVAASCKALATSVASDLEVPTSGAVTPLETWASTIAREAMR